MDVVRTPDERFIGLPGYTFVPHYIEFGGVRIHYLDEGSPDAAPVVLMHGEPSWSYLYRKMIPPLVRAGHRVLAPDLMGFGRSDKPTRREDYTYQRHVDFMGAWLKGQDLKRVTLVCQDWGGLIGLRLAAENGERFSRIVAANTFLPTGDQEPGEAFLKWRRLSQEMPDFRAGEIVRRGCVSQLPPEVVAAYDAPFPDDQYLAGARSFPMLVPIRPDDPASAANRAAWDELSRWKKPFLTTFSDSDKITRGLERIFQSVIPGCAGQPHVTITNAGHFLQEDKGHELARVVADFIASTPVS